MKSILDRIFVDGLGGMAHGLFATLIIGTIIQQIGLFAGGDFGNMLYMAGKMAAAMTGAGIGAGVARKFNADQLVAVSAATVGMIGAFAGKLLAGEVLTDGNVFLAGPGEPLGAFVAAYVAIEIGILISGKTKLDILITPFVCIGVGTATGLVVGPPISRFMGWLGSLINWGTEQQPFLMGIVVSVLMGMILTLPISSAAIGVILNLSGLAAGDDRLLLQYGRVCRGKFPGKWVRRTSGAGDRHIDASGSEYRKTPEDLAAGNPFQRDLRTGRYDASAYDEQRDRIRHGNRRVSGTDHDLAGNDTDRSAGGRALEDPPDPDRSSGGSHIWIFGIHAA